MQWRRLTSLVLCSAFVLYACDSKASLSAPTPAPTAAPTPAPTPAPFSLVAEPSVVNVVATRTTITLKSVTFGPDFVFTEFRCVWVFTLRAVGGNSSSFATLIQADEYGSTGVKTKTLSAAELIVWFGTDRVKSGQSVSVAMSGAKPGAWQLMLYFIYRDPDGANRTVTATANCS